MWWKKKVGNASQGEVEARAMPKLGREANYQGRRRRWPMPKDIAATQQGDNKAATAR